MWQAFKREGKRDFGRTNSLPLTFVTPATQASLNLSCNSKVARFFFIDGKMPNIPIQLILQQIHKTSCTFFVACFTIPLSRELNHFVSTGQLYESNKIVRRIQDCPARSVFFLNSMHDSKWLLVKISRED